MAHASNDLIAIAAVTATASLSSMIGSAFILVCYAILPSDRHFRHILILNLAASDFVHSLNNAIADLFLLSHKRVLEPSLACAFNGFVEQVTNQATDCSILAITITTVYAITRRVPISAALQGDSRYIRISLICCAIWAFPFFTGSLAFGMRWYGPVSGSWCWIIEKPKYLRYVLMHNWRFLFIIIEISLYIYLDIHLRRHFRMLSDNLSSRGAGSHLAQNESPQDLNACTSTSESSKQAANFGPVNSNPGVKLAEFSELGVVGVIRNSKPRTMFGWFRRVTGLRKRNQRMSHSFTSDPHYQAVQRILLLNSYPLAYIILWIPAIVNRFIEVTGRSSTVMQFLQVTAQLVGLANALTFGWNERVTKQLKDRFSK